MIRDEELRSSLDYSEGQKEAAHRVLVELVNLFNEYRDDIRIVGGWVPDLMFPGEGHVGSIDVDVLINHIKLKDNGYLTMAKILLRNGYKEHPEKYFSFVKQVQVDGISYDVDVDILAGMYGGTQKKKRSQHVQGVKALKATGGNFAFEFDPQTVRIEAERTDGAMDVFCDVEAYVSCRGYAGIPPRARNPSVKQGGTADKRTYSSLTEK